MEEKNLEHLYRLQKNPGKYSNKYHKDKLKKKLATIESILHVVAHGHTRTVRVTPSILT